LIATSPRRVGAATPGAEKNSGKSELVGDHRDVIVTSLVEPSAYTSMAVYRGASPGVTSDGPSMRNSTGPVGADGCDGVGAGAAGDRLQLADIARHAARIVVHDSALQ
jgi:hypothetical protein